MQIELNSEQLSYLKGLDSKKKQRKFLLDCILENIIDKPNIWKPIIFKDGCFTTNDKDIIKVLSGFMNIGLVEEIPHTNKSETFKNDHEILMQKMEKSKGQILKLKEANLSPNQIEAVLEYLSGFEQLKGSVIPIRFREDAQKQEIFNKFPNPHDLEKAFKEEKVDLSKELYLTYKNQVVVRVSDFEKGYGYCHGRSLGWIELGTWNWNKKPQDWRKSTTEEIKSMLIKKLEADGLKSGCTIDQTVLGPNYTKWVLNINCDLVFEYTDYDDTLCLGGAIMYRQGKFATIIPQEELKEEEFLPYCVKVVDSNVEELTKLYNSIKTMEVKEIPTGMWLVCDTDNLEVINTPYKIVNTSDFMSYFQRYSSHAQLNQSENNELVNSSDEIKNIIVVDFENVSQKENPQ